MILDSRDHSFGSPVNVSIDGNSFNIFVENQVGIRSWVQEGFLEFLVSHGRELVDAHLVCLGGVLVMFLDDFEILFEDESSEGIFFMGKGLSKLLFPDKIVIFLSF